MSELRRKTALSLYEILEVSPRASQDVIHAAYRVLARNSHPDHNATSEAGPRIRQLNAAFEILGNPEQRARYDFECMRARRPALVAAATPPVTRAASGRGADQFAITSAPRPRSVEDRRGGFSARTVFAFGLVIFLMIAVLVVVWVGVDAVPNDMPMRAGPTVNLSRP